MPSSPYILYARKSSESEDRQVLSIDSQIQELRSLAVRQGVEIAAVLSESRSAKAPGRPIFSEMMQRLAKDRVRGVLCWKLDRLARNPVDGGALIWAIDQGMIAEVVTPGRTFANRGDDKLWMQLEFGMAKKYVDDLSENVKRGNRAKLELGWLPGLPTTGYLNDPVTRTIIRDPDRFEPVRRIWQLALDRTPLARIRDIANDEWGFRTRTSRRHPGGPLALSTLYKLLSNPFYYGLIVRNGETFPGRHKAMITRDEFDRVQEFLGRPNRATPKRRTFPFTGLIRCGECGLSVTAEEKVNRYGYHYTYYHCTKRRGSCSQRMIRAEVLEDQMLEVLKRITVPKRVLSWAARHMDELRAKDRRDRVSARATVDAALKSCDAKLSRLTDLRLSDRIGDAEYTTKRQELIEEKLRLVRSGDEESQDREAWFEPLTQYLSFLVFAEKRFRTGEGEEKAAIVRALGSNLSLKDQKLTIQVEKPFLLKEQGSSFSTWWALVERARTFFTEHPHSIQWPNFCRDWVARKLMDGRTRSRATAGRSRSSRARTRLVWDGRQSSACHPETLWSGEPAHLRAGSRGKV